MKCRVPGLALFLVLTAGFNLAMWAQGGPPETVSTPRVQGPKPDYFLQPGEDPENRLVSPFVKHLVGDQKQFWTEPTRLHVQDLKWIAPFAGVTAAFIASDSWWAKQIPLSHVATSKKISDYGTYSLIGLGGASFVFGHMNHDDHLSETGLLAGEAAIDSTAVAYAFKEITQRQRPYQGNGNGDFFVGGASFPSEHSAVAWSIASIWAHEYPGWFSQMAAYGLASTITTTRVTAKQHFPSDAIIGSALGWYFGRQVYRAHHDPEIGGSGWGPLIDHATAEHARNTDNMASPYVPIDSWVYPAIERLAALGYIDTAYLGIRPWTRMACARMLEQAAEKLHDDGMNDSEAGKTYRALTGEFATETARLDGGPNVGARLDSIYTRALGISGTPLRDGYHFGQTIINDYGRPYWNGFNDVTGLTADAEVGPVAFYFQGEYQHAPAIPSDPPPVLAATAAADLTVPLANGQNQLDRFRLLDSAALFQVNNVQFSAGTESSWLGPGEAGSLLMSNNAPPFPTFKVDSVTPYEIPLLSRLLGPARTEFFIGQLSGQTWEFDGSNVVGPYPTPQPFIHGEKISFKPTANFELGMGVTAMFGGPGLPVTWHNFFRTFFSHTSGTNNPGKRFSAADFTYRVPGIRKWLSVYADSLVVDEYSPIGSSRANINPGIYMPQIPKIPKMEFRAEGVNESRTDEFAPGFVYYGLRRYRSGYTNDGYLLGSSVGRAGRGAQGWLTYSISPHNQVQLGYRLQTVAPNFVCVQPAGSNCSALPGAAAPAGGGRSADYSAQGKFMLRHDLSVSGLFQYEQWRFPVLAPTRQVDVTASFQLTYYPKWRIGR